MSTSIGPEEILRKRKEFMFPCTSHFYKEPPQIVKGHMQYLYDDQGRQYTDFFAGVSVLNCGHCNPEIVEATLKQVQELHHTCTLYLTEPMVNLAERLASLYPGDIKHSFFCCTGSEANEGALLTARLYTNKPDFIALKTGLHGRTQLTMDATGIPMWRTDPYLPNHVHFVQNMDGIGEQKEQQARQSLQEVKEILEQHHERIAAMIVEIIQGNGGIIVPPTWYFKELKQLLESYGVLLIVDEIQTGFARTGKMFAVEHYDIKPDIMTVAKALGNGIPISAFATTSEIAGKFTKPSASTFGGNPVAAQTALAVLDYIEKHNLQDRSATLGAHLQQELEALQRKYPVMNDVRGMGLMIAVPLVTDGKPEPELTDAILEEMKDRGFIIGKNGLYRNCLAFQPPLVIEKSDIDQMLQALDVTLQKLS